MCIRKVKEICSHFLKNMLPERLRVFSRNFVYKEKCAFTKCEITDFTDSFKTLVFKERNNKTIENKT